MDTFRQFIEKYTPVSDGDWATISGCLEHRIIEKDETLLAEGQVCRHLYFIESGLLHFFINKDGSDVTKFFTVAPYCFTSQVSFTSAEPARESIRAIEKSVILQITLKKAEALLELKSWNIFVRKLILEVQSFTEELLREMQMETAALRYEKMLLNNSHLVQRLPLKYLASYLGIAPQSLSRIRNKLVDKDRS